MDNGTPNTKIVNVDGIIDTAAKINAEVAKQEETRHVLETGTRKDGVFYMAVCNEEPSFEVCRECVRRFQCSFSRAKEL